MTIKNSLRKIAGAGLTLTALAIAGCDKDKLRMETGECPGVYREHAGTIFDNTSYNYLTSRVGDTTLILTDYTDRTVDWNKIGAKSEVRKDSIDRVIINAPGLSEIITASDSNSNTISGVRARDWLIRGNDLYRRARECFIDWARRDYQKTHPQP